MRRELLIVAKRPAAGHTKTRLCPPLAGDTAAQLYEAFLLDTLEIMRGIAGIQRTIAFMPEDARSYFVSIAPDFDHTPQRGIDLGERLDTLLCDALAQGADLAIVMSSDSPNLPARMIEAAFTQLECGADVVLGPSEDGGYYLVGLKKPQPRLFREVVMSTATVLQETVQLAEELDLRVALLDSWYDVDTIDDLRRLRADLSDAPPHIAARTRALLDQLLSE